MPVYASSNLKKRHPCLVCHIVLHSIFTVHMPAVRLCKHDQCMVAFCKRINMHALFFPWSRYATLILHPCWSQHVAHGVPTTSNHSSSVASCRHLSSRAELRVPCSSQQLLTLRTSSVPYFCDTWQHSDVRPTLTNCCRRRCCCCYC